MHRSDLVIVLAIFILSCSSSMSFPAHYSSPKGADDKQVYHGQISQPVYNAHASNSHDKSHLTTCNPASACGSLAGGSIVDGGAKVTHQASVGVQVKGEVRGQGSGGSKLYARATGDDFEAKFVLEAQKRAHKQ